VKVGMIGLGVMGRPMATNLLGAGFELAVYNRSVEPMQALAEKGATPEGSAADVAHVSDVVITMLPDSAAVEEVVLGDGGVLGASKEGLLFLDMSTVAPATARRIYDAARSRAVRSLDAPVSGGEQGAIDGTLSIMIGGDEDAYAAARPIFEILGKTVVHVGPAGAGQTVKAANQLIVAGVIELVAEAIVLLEACGLDPEPAVKVIAGGLAGNRVLDLRGESMLRRDFRPGARVDLHHKDLTIMLDTARECDAVVPVGALVAQLMSALRATGRGSLDHTALLQVVEELSGRRRA
jgi:2-hydroxy-3-oxopropionate reductase